MTKLNASIYHIQIPEKMKRLPISAAGYPVPWFVATTPSTGERDFRVADEEKMYMAVKRSLCWLCGQQLGVHKAFVLGPMCSITRTISEPPCHLECAEYAVKACPFLTMPRMRRNGVDLPEEHVPAAGLGLKRNPGACAVWVTLSFKVFREGRGILFTVGDPEKVTWFANGRTATRAEVEESIRTGMHHLEELAEAEGPEAEQELAARVRVAEALLPAA